MSNDVEMLSARIPSELKRLVDVDGRTNQQVVEAALWREFGGERKAAIERRIEEKENRINIIEREKNERKRELEQENAELEALKVKRDKIEGKEDKQHEAAIRKCERVPANPTNPLIQKEADNVGMTPEEFAREVAEEYNKEFQDPDADSDLRSI